MKIVICNSVKFFKEALDAKQALESIGHAAFTHPMSVQFGGKDVPIADYYAARKSGWNKEIEDLKERLMRKHTDKIKESDAILVLNLDKDGKKNYIGGNTFLEMGVAFALGKKIFLLNPIPDVPYAEELKGMKPIILDRDLQKIR